MKLTRRNLLAGGAGAVALAATARAGQAAGPNGLTHDPDQPVLGNPQGDVTIVEFYDYQCPFCRDNHPALLQLVQDDGNLRLVMRDWPIFGAASLHAMKLGLGAVDLGRYRQVNTALMAISGRRIEPTAFDAVVREAGVEPQDALASFTARESAWQALLDRTARFAEAAGIRGTPTYVIGQEIFQGVTTARAMRHAIGRVRRA